MPVTPRIVLVGGGAFAREVLCWIEQAQAAQALPERLGYLDREATLAGNGRYNLDYLGDIAEFTPGPHDRLVMAVGDPHGKRHTAEILSGRGGTFQSIIHPSAVIASTARIGHGCVICPLSLVSADANVADLVSINTMSSVGHDVQVGQYTTLSSHVDLMGSVVVEDLVFLGSGSRVLPKVKVKAGAKIGAGSVVGRTVKEGATMYTSFARRL